VKAETVQFLNRLIRFLKGGVFRTFQELCPLFVKGLQLV
jgi:hypothetical protein